MVGVVAILTGMVRQLIGLRLLRRIRPRRHKFLVINRSVLGNPHSPQPESFPTDY